MPVETERGDIERVKAWQPTVSSPASGWRKQVSPMCVFSLLRRLKYLVLLFKIQGAISKGLVGW